MKALIIDNESNIRSALKQLLAVNCAEVLTVAEADGVSSGLAAISALKPDLVFLDVEMDDGTGIELLQKLGHISFQLIFITAHNKYAIDAFRFSAIDFLLKPIDAEELRNAVQKAAGNHQNNQLKEQIAVLQDSLQVVLKKNKKLVLKDSASIYFVQIDDIIRCESESQYTEFFLVDGSRIVISKSLKEYEEMLEPFGFIRPHHSHLINLNKIVRFDKNDGGHLLMQNNHQVPVSQRKKTQILQILENL